MMQHRVSEQEYNARIANVQESARTGDRGPISSGFELGGSQFANRINGVPYAWRTVEGNHDNAKFYLLK